MCCSLQGALVSLVEIRKSIIVNYLTQNVDKVREQAFLRFKDTGALESSPSTVLK